jgi:site-specific recombinase XerD
MKFHDAIKEFTAWKTFTVKDGTSKGYDLDLRSLALYLRNPEIETIGWEHIQEFSNGMLQLGWDKNTIARKFMAFRKFFQYWHKKNPKVLDPEWIPVLHFDMKQPKVIDEENYHKILAAIPTERVDIRHIRNRAMLNILWDTGARNGEVLSLDIDDLNFTTQKAVIRTEKARFRRKYREIFWTDETNNNLKLWIDKRAAYCKKNANRITDPKAVFINVSGTKPATRMLNAGFSELLRTLCDRADIQHFNPHSFRHHMGHDIIKKGGSNSDVSNILGHSSLESSYVYTMMNDQELENRYRHFKGK